MKLSLKSLINWKLLLPALLLSAGLVFFSSHQMAHAQSDCVDPATGAACTPVPPPSCGVAGAPPCEPPPSRPKPTKTPTPRPRPTRTSTPTATETVTPTATTTTTDAPTLPPRPTEPVQPTLPPRPTEPPQSTPTARPIISGWIAAIKDNILPKNTQVTPKSLPGAWGGLIDQFISWVNNLFPGKPNSIVAKDLLWLTKVNVVEGDHYYCIGGPMCPNAETYTGNKIKVLIMPEGVVAPKVNDGIEENFYPTLCLGSTGKQGCASPIVGQRLNPDDQSLWGWSVDNYFFQKYGKSLPGIYTFDLPPSWVSGPGTHQFTAYINYNQQAFLENYDNNFVTFSFKVAGDPSMSMAKGMQTSTPTVDNQFYLANFLVVLQDENCVLGCSVTTNGWINAGKPVEVYVQGLQFLEIFKGSTLNKYVDDPVAAAMFTCKGATGQNGCASPLPADLPPYAIPQWFLDSPDSNLLSNQPGIVRFTIPGNQISSAGIYKFTFYVNYQQQATPEADMSDNIKTIYMNAIAPQ
jgi:hypothetical protein